MISNCIFCPKKLTKKTFFPNWKFWMACPPTFPYQSRDNLCVASQSWCKNFKCTATATAWSKTWFPCLFGSCKMKLVRQLVIRICQISKWCHSCTAQAMLQMMPRRSHTTLCGRLKTFVIRTAFTETTWLEWTRRLRSGRLACTLGSTRQTTIIKVGWRSWGPNKPMLKWKRSIKEFN